MPRMRGRGRQQDDLCTCPSGLVRRLVLEKLTPLLQRQGHEVFTPTLTGLGERAHLARPEIGLEIHVRDITNVIEYEDLRNVILVGNGRRHCCRQCAITGTENEGGSIPLERQAGTSAAASC
jgi:hypothetical protein